MTSQSGSGSSKSVTVQGDRDTVIDLSGLRVILPAGAVDDGSSVQVTQGAGDQQDLPSYLKPLGPSLAVSLSGTTQPRKPAELRFPIPAGSDLHEYVVVWQDTEGAGWRWLPTRLDGQTAIAQTDHFSRGILAGVDISKWVSDRKQDLVNYFTGRSGAANPDCGDERSSGGVKVTSDGGDRVKWCYGRQKGRHVLKVTNNTRTYMQISYPSSWPLVDGASITANSETLARAVGMLAAVPAGKKSRIVDGGDTLTLAVPPGSSGRVRAEFSALAWLATAFIFGAETYAGVSEAANGTLGKSAKGAADRVAAFLGGDTKALDGQEEFLDCMDEAGGLDHLDPATGKDIAKIVWRCTPLIMATQMKDVRLWAAGILVKMVATVVEAVLTSVNLLVTGLREVWDTVASLGGTDDPLYDIVLRAPTPRLIRYPNPGVLIRSAADLAKLHDAPAGFKGFILEAAKRIQTTNQQTCPAIAESEPGGVIVDMIRTDGFASGAALDCSGYETLWAQVDGRWREVGGSQYGWNCSMLRQFRIPDALTNGTCWPDNGDEPVAYVQP